MSLCFLSPLSSYAGCVPQQESPLTPLFPLLALAVLQHTSPSFSDFLAGIHA